MKEEKIDKAAQQSWYDSPYGTFLSMFKYAFKQGIKWTIQQPLSERLTDEEKKEIKSIMKYPQRHTELIEGTIQFQVLGIQRVLTEIFGEDFFKEK